MSCMLMVISRWDMPTQTAVPAIFSALMDWFAVGSTPTASKEVSIMRPSVYFEMDS